MPEPGTYSGDVSTAETDQWGGWNEQPDGVAAEYPVVQFSRDLEVSPDPPPAGERYEVTIYVENVGDGSISAGWQYRIRLTTATGEVVDKTLPGQEMQPHQHRSGTVPLGPLQPGESNTFEIWLETGYNTTWDDTNYKHRVITCSGEAPHPHPHPHPHPQPHVDGPPWPGRYLRLYDSGDDVLTWQQRMYERGWRQIPVSGYFDDETDRVCHMFQEEKGLADDGIVGPITWEAAWSAPIT